MKKAALLLMGLTIISKILGFIRELVLAYYYGTSDITDAYLIALTIPGVIFAFVGIGISTTFIPIYSSIKEEKSKIKSTKYVNSVINFLLIICTIIVILVFLFPEAIVKVFASGFEGETLNLAVFYTKIFIFGIYSSALLHVFIGYLHAHNNFKIPGLLGIPFNLIVIISIILSAKFSHIILIFGSLLAKFIEVAILLPFLKKNNYKFKFLIDVKDENFRKMFYLGLPVIIGVSVNQINVLVDRTIASQISTGAISSLHYANILNTFVHGIFIMSIVTVLYPLISRKAADKDINGLKDSVKNSINAVNILVVPITVGYLILAEPIVRVAFGRGAFDEQSIINTSGALFYYAIGMIAVGMREILARVFYSLQDTKTPMINASIALFLNIILNILLSRVMGINGIALATSVSAIVGAILLFFSLRRKIGSLHLKILLKNFLKIIFASLVMGFLVFIFYNYFSSSSNQVIVLLVTVVIGSATYFLLIFLLKIESISLFLASFKQKVKKI